MFLKFFSIYLICWLWWTFPAAWAALWSWWAEALWLQPGLPPRWRLLLRSGCSGRGPRSCRAWALGHRLGSLGTQAQLRQDLWDLPGPGKEPMSPALAGGFFTMSHQGSPPDIFNTIFVGPWVFFKSLKFVGTSGFYLHRYPWLQSLQVATSCILSRIYNCLQWKRWSGMCLLHLT